MDPQSHSLVEHIMISGGYGEFFIFHVSYLRKFAKKYRHDWSIKYLRKVGIRDNLQVLKINKRYRFPIIIGNIGR